MRRQHHLMGIKEDARDPVEMITLLAQQQQRRLRCNGNLHLGGDAQALAAHKAAFGCDDPRGVFQPLLLMFAQQSIYGHVSRDDDLPVRRDGRLQQFAAAAIAKKIEHALSKLAERTPPQHVISGWQRL